MNECLNSGGNVPSGGLDHFLSKLVTVFLIMLTFWVIYLVGGIELVPWSFLFKGA